MPIPIIIGGALLIATLAGTTALLVKKIRKKLKGKHLYIVGDKHSGKTTLFHLLQGKGHPEYKQTIKNKKEIDLPPELQKDLGFQVTLIVDTIPVNNEIHENRMPERNPYCEIAIKDPNGILVFIINAFNFKDYKEYEQKYIQDELKGLAKLAKVEKKRILCIVNYIDKYPDFDKLHIQKQAPTDKYFDRDLIQGFKNYFLPVDFIFVSLEKGYHNESLKIISEKLHEIITSEK
jgi:GTPase SAR1 family protein